MTLSKNRCEDVAALVAQMQALGSELNDVEAKDGRRGLPQKIYESVSGLANRRGGGLIIFGLEDGTFRPVGGIDVASLQTSLTSFIDQRMSYPLRLDLIPCQIAGETILVAVVPECPAAHKPVYYRGKGLIGGSYLRVGNSNHVLSDAEVRAILRTTDRDDTDGLPVSGAARSDLSADMIDAYRRTLAERKPESELHGLADDELLIAVRAVASSDGRLVPTLAGLLFFAPDPQQWLPGTFISFVQFAGTEVAHANQAAPVYMDNIRIAGPVPQMIEEARRAILARIRKRALLEGFTRREIPEYPDWAYREAVVNAVAHRDYAISGAHIQIRIFADRLEVQSPGGLFGTVSEASIEYEQSTRNHAVVRLLEDHGLVEQRGIGIDRMVKEMLSAGLERPVFRDSLTSFQVVLKNHTMMDEDAYRWLSGFADYQLTDSQRMALVYVWRTGRIVNRDFQRLNSVDTVPATRALKKLVDAGLLRQHGTRGSAYYTLAEVPSLRARRDRTADDRAVLEHVRRYGRITNAEGRELLEIGDVWTMRLILRRLVRRGLLTQHGAAKQHTYYQLGPNA